jgi:hypothetical protein
MNPLQISPDPRWYRFMDGIVILSIGFVVGMVAAYSIVLSQLQDETQTITVPVQLKTDNSKGKVLETTDTNSTQLFEVEES